MKTKLFAALFLCGVALSATADDGKVDVLYVDGTSHVITLSQVAKLQVADDNAVFYGKDGKITETHKISDIEKITLTAATSSISQTKGENGIVVRSDGNTVSVEGLADGKSLEIFSAGGELLKKAASVGDKASVDVSSLANGVYVVKADGKSLKMVKR